MSEESTKQEAPSTKRKSAGAAPELKTAEEIAAIYQVHRNTVHLWHREGMIPAAVNVGKVIRFREKEVARALKKITAETEAGRSPQMVMVI